jgi:hypothetical protein
LEGHIEFLISFLSSSVIRLKPVDLDLIALEADVGVIVFLAQQAGDR